MGSSPNFTYGQVPTVLQWQAYFATKQDDLGYTPLNQAGGTMQGLLKLMASDTAIGAGLNVPPGTNPTSPNNGDVWMGADGLYYRNNGTTVGPLTVGANAWKAASSYATTAALPANTYSNGTSGVGATLTATANGALTVDSASPVIGDRILVKNEVAAANNGIYSVTATGDASHPYILTRTTDFDVAAEMVAGVSLAVTGGTVNSATYWTLTSTVTTVGTDAVNFQAFSTAASYTAGTGIDIAGTVISINALYQATIAAAVQTSSLGTGIATFLGTPSSANLAAALTDETGTGAAVFAGSPAFTGTPTFAGSTSGTTGVKASATASGTLTLPAATDTLIGKATTDTLTNKTFDTAGTGNSFKINGTAISAVSGSGAVALVTGSAIGLASASGLLAAGASFAATQRVLGRNSAGAGVGEEVTASQILDWIGTAAQGDILYRDAAGWAFLAPGTSGYFLQTNGAGANPTWGAGGGGLGVGQTWQDVSASRAWATSYQNTTGKPIDAAISVHTTDISQTVTMQVSSDNITFYTLFTIQLPSSGDGTSFSAIIPNNYYYKITRTSSSNTIDTWVELR